MSNNAQRNVRADAHKAPTKEWDLEDLAGLQMEAAAEEAEEEKQQLAAAKRVRNAIYREGKEFVSAHGVEALVNKAKAEFCEATEATLPWNLDCRSGGDFNVHGIGQNYGPGILGRHGDWRFPAEADEILSQWARFAGWLRTAKELPALARMITKTQGKGQGSFRTYYDLWDMQKRWKSPHKLERMVRAVRKRGNEILSAYEGKPNVSYKGIALGLLVERSVGKAAVAAVAVSLGIENEFGELNYKIARGLLVDYHLCKVPDNSDGVSVVREEKPRLVKMGIEVYKTSTPIFTPKGFVIGYRFAWLVKSPTAEGRTFHARSNQYFREKDALKEAIVAWKCRALLETKDADLVGFLKGTRGYCPLVVRRDSYDAGNCAAGTQSWMNRQGWGNKEFIPSTWLIPHLGHDLVKNVAMQLYRQYAK